MEVDCMSSLVSVHGVVCAFAVVLCGASSAVAANELPAPTGQGAGPCSSYLELVDGSWQNPLNALNFHGYVSWASGYVSARAEAPAALRDQEPLKLALVDYCREHPEQSFAGAVEALITQP
jgi:hypothetical protein